MSPFQTTWLVAQRELRERARTRAFQISTVFTILLVIGVIVVPQLLSDDGPTEWTIGASGETPPGLAEAIESTAVEETVVDIEAFPTEGELRIAVTESEVDIGVVDGATVLEGPDTPPTLTQLLVGSLTAAAVADQAGALGLSPEDLASLGEAGPTVEQLEPDDDEEARLFIAFIGTVILFVSIVSYGQWILIGVVEEKTSRVVEVILGAVRPRHLLAGKILGIGLLGLAQLVVIAMVSLLAARYVSAIDIPDVGASIATIVIGWFLLGFAFYAAGFAVAGSLVSRQEDAQNAAYPLTLVMLIGYFVGTSALGTGGDNPVVRILSIVPPFSPLTMPMRQAVGDAAAWEVALSVALMLAAIVAMLRIGGRVYAGGLLRGGRVKAREAFRSAET